MGNWEKGLKAQSSKLKVGDRRQNSEGGIGNGECGMKNEMGRCGW
jgi:hypothetical protein